MHRQLTLFKQLEPLEADSTIVASANVDPIAARFIRMRFYSQKLAAVSDSAATSITAFGGGGGGGNGALVAGGVVVVERNQWQRAWCYVLRTITASLQNFVDEPHVLQQVGDWLALHHARLWFTLSSVHFGAPSLADLTLAALDELESISALLYQFSKYMAQLRQRNTVLQHAAVSLVRRLNGALIACIVPLVTALRQATSFARGIQALTGAERLAWCNNSHNQPHCHRPLSSQRADTINAPADGESDSTFTIDRLGQLCFVQQMEYGIHRVLANALSVYRLMQHSQLWLVHRAAMANVVDGDGAAAEEVPSSKELLHVQSFALEALRRFVPRGAGAARTSEMHFAPELAHTSKQTLTLIVDNCLYLIWLRRDEPLSFGAISEEELAHQLVQFLTHYATYIQREQQEPQEPQKQKQQQTPPVHQKVPAATTAAATALALNERDPMRLLMEVFRLSYGAHDSTIQVSQSTNVAAHQPQQQQLFSTPLRTPRHVHFNLPDSSTSSTSTTPTMPAIRRVREQF
jgi:hypothetical protein